MDATTQNLDCNKTINQFGVVQFWSGNECERAHTLTTTTTGSKNSHKGVNSQVDYQNHNALGPPPPPPKGLSFTGLGTQLKSSARDTLSNQQAQLKEAETGKSYRKCSKGHFQGSLLLL